MTLEDHLLTKMFRQAEKDDLRQDGASVKGRRMLKDIYPQKLVKQKGKDDLAQDGASV